MSTLKADTIQSTSGGAATLTKQSAAKHFVAYDAVNETVEESLNQSNLFDVSTGRYYSTFISAMSGIAAKVNFVSVANTVNDGTSHNIGDTRGGAVANIGSSDGGSRAFSASEVQFYSGYGSSGSSDGAVRDFSAVYCSTFGDLA